MLINCLAVGIGGAIGSISRYLFGLIPIQTSSGFPLSTLGINITGAFCVGLIVGVASKNTGFSPHLLLLLKVGLCGGFTTFSAFSIETVELMQNGKLAIAVLYVVVSVALCIFATAGAHVIINETF